MNSPITAGHSTTRRSYAGEFRQSATLMVAPRFESILPIEPPTKDARDVGVPAVEPRLPRGKNRQKNSSDKTAPSKDSKLDAKEAPGVIRRPNRDRIRATSSGSPGHSPHGREIPGGHAHPEYPSSELMMSKVEEATRVFSAGPSRENSPAETSP